MRIEYAPNPKFMATLTAGAAVFPSSEGIALEQTRWGTAVSLRSHDLLLGRQWSLSPEAGRGLKAMISIYYDEAEILSADFFEVVNVRYKSQLHGPFASMVREVEAYRLAEELGCEPADILNDVDMMINTVQVRLYAEFAFDRPHRITLVPKRATPGEKALIESVWANSEAEVVEFWRNREIDHPGHAHLRDVWLAGHSDA